MAILKMVLVRAALPVLDTNKLVMSLPTSNAVPASVGLGSSSQLKTSRHDQHIYSGMGFASLALVRCLAGEMHDVDLAFLKIERGVE